MKTER